MLILMLHTSRYYVSEYEKKGNFVQNVIFNMPPFQTSKNPRLQTWFICS